MCMCMTMYGGVYVCACMSMRRPEVKLGYYYSGANLPCSFWLTMLYTYTIYYNHIHLITFFLSLTTCIFLFPSAWLSSHIYLYTTTSPILSQRDLCLWAMDKSKLRAFRINYWWFSLLHWKSVSPFPRPRKHCWWGYGKQVRDGRQEGARRGAWHISCAHE